MKCFRNHINITCIPCTDFTHHQWPTQMYKSTISSYKYVVATGRVKLATCPDCVGSNLFGGYLLGMGVYLQTIYYKLLWC